VLRSLICVVCVALICLAAALPGARAQEPERGPRPAIRVSGEAVVSAKPDQAQVAIGVVTQAATAQAAAAQNAQQLETTLKALRAALGAGADIKTISYSVTPNYQYPREGGNPTIKGYTASNTVQVKTGDLNQVGKIIDTATQAGANQVQSLQFTLKDEAAVRAQALREAAAKARAEADALASALGVKITRILLAEEAGSPIVRPYMADMAMRAGAAAPPPPTPIEPGAIEVRATVTLTVEIAQ